MDDEDRGWLQDGGHFYFYNDEGSAAMLDLSFYVRDDHDMAGAECARINFLAEYTGG